MAEQVSGRRQLKDKIRHHLLGEKRTESYHASGFEGSEDTAIDIKKPEEVYEHNCDPCKSFGDILNAEGFCTVCKEYLCNTCFRSHSRNKVSKHHYLLKKDDMPKKTSRLCNPCRKAGDKIKAVGYCKNCCDFLCYDCFKSHPRNKFSKGHMLVKEEQFEHIDQVGTSPTASMSLEKKMTSAKNMPADYIYVRDINVKSVSDKNNCFITSMTFVSSNSLVLGDCDNKCLKLVDTDKNRIQDVLQLPSNPLGITAISNKQIAVAFDSKYQIQIVGIHAKLIVEHIIKTNGICLDVTMTNRHLYVSFHSPVKFQKLKLTGEVIKTIQPDDDILKNCTHPRYITASPDESVIYVSDWKSNKIMSLDMNGNVLAMFQGEIEEPHGITISASGSIYVCNRKQDVVYKMKSDLSEALVILGPGDGLVYPHAICMNNDNQHLFISSGSLKAKYKNVLKIYKL